MGAYLHTLEGSRPEQAHEIRPNCIYYNYDYGDNKNQRQLSESQGNEWTTAGEVDKIDKMQENVLTNAMKHKETIVQKHFRQKLSSLGSRRQTTKEEGSKEEDRQEGAEVKKFKNEYVR